MTTDETPLPHRSAVLRFILGRYECPVEMILRHPVEPRVAEIGAARDLTYAVWSYFRGGRRPVYPSSVSRFIEVDVGWAQRDLSDRRPPPPEGDDRMAPRAKNLTDEVRDVLRAAEVEIAGGKGPPYYLTLPPKLEPRLYRLVNEALERVGGKWSRGDKAHVFSVDPRPALDELIGGAAAPARNPLAYFPTPPEVVEEMLDRADVAGLMDGAAVLEPSAGEGAIADAILAANPGVRLCCVEKDPIRAATLQARGHERVWCADFLAWERPPGFEPGFSAILMNPPFAVEGGAHAYVSHVMRAANHLAPGGRLLAVCPAGFTVADRPRHLVEFRRQISEWDGWFRGLPDGTFADAGTEARTCLVYMEAPRDRTPSRPLRASEPAPPPAPEPGRRARKAKGNASPAQADSTPATGPPPEAVDLALLAALGVGGPAGNGPFAPLIEPGGTDSEILDAIRAAFGPRVWSNVEHVVSGDHAGVAYTYRGGDAPAFWAGWHRARDGGTPPRPTLHGRQLIARVRDLLGIPLPAPEKILDALMEVEGEIRANLESLRGTLADATGVGAPWTEDDALRAALNHREGSAANWARWAESGLSDLDMTLAIAGAFGTEEGGCRDGCTYVFAGGDRPRFWFNRTKSQGPTLSGRDLVAAARRLMGIPTPVAGSPAATGSRAGCHAPGTIGLTTYQGRLVFASNARLPTGWPIEHLVRLPPGVTDARCDEEHVYIPPRVGLREGFTPQGLLLAARNRMFGLSLGDPKETNP